MDTPQELIPKDGDCIVCLKVGKVKRASLCEISVWMSTISEKINKPRKKTVNRNQGKDLLSISIQGYHKEGRSHSGERGFRPVE